MPNWKKLITSGSNASLASLDVAGTLTLAAGSITDSTGTISFGNENLSTTGDLSAANASLSGNITIDRTGDSAISFSRASTDRWTIGSDVTAGDLFTIAQGGTLGTTNALVIDGSRNFDFQSGNITTSGSGTFGDGSSSNQLTVTGTGNSNGAVLRVLDTNAVSIVMEAPSPTIMWLETDTTDQNFMVRASGGVLQFGVQNDAITSFQSKTTFNQSGNWNFGSGTLTTTGTLTVGTPLVTPANNVARFGGVSGGSNSGTVAIETNTDGFAISINENGAGEFYQLGVTSDGSLGFYNSGAGTATLLLGDDDSATFSGPLSSGAATVTDTFDLDATTATGSPAIRLSQAGTRRSYIQHIDSGDDFRVVSEYGTVSLWAGSGGTESKIVDVSTTGASITGSLHISGSSNALVVEGSGSTIFDVQGSQGQLFSVTDDLTGTLFSVNDISGIPILAVRDDDYVTIGTFGAEGLIVSGSKVYLSEVTGSGNATFAGDLTLSAGDLFVDTTELSTTSNNADLKAQSSLRLTSDSNANGTGDIIFYHGTTEVGRFDNSDDGAFLLGSTSTSNNAQFYATKTYSNASGTDLGTYLNYDNDTARSGRFDGIRSLAENSHTTGTSTTLVSVMGIANATGAGGTTTSAMALRASIGANNATATITNAYGVYIDSFTATGTITNRWGIYQAGASENNYLAGDLRIGTTSAVGSESLTVSGDVYADGTIRATGDVYAYYSSDERLKTNITPIEDATAKLKQIGGYDFDWVPVEGVHENEGHDIGVLAQEVEKVAPEIVVTRENGYKAVRYEKLVAILIQSNKELLKRIEALEEKLQ